MVEGTDGGVAVVIMFGSAARWLITGSDLQCRSGSMWLMLDRKMEI